MILRSHGGERGRGRSRHDEPLFIVEFRGGGDEGRTDRHGIEHRPRAADR